MAVTKVATELCHYTWLKVVWNQSRVYLCQTNMAMQIPTHRLNAVYTKVDETCLISFQSMVTALCEV